MKVGIACDDYKVDKFKQELSKNGFDKVNVTRLMRGTQLITIETTDDKKETLRRLCVKMEHGFKRSN